MADDWKSPAFRQSVVAKIDEAIRQSGNPTTKTAGEMETHFFLRATTKEDYLNFLARLLIHIKDLSAKQKAAGVAGPAVGGNIQQQNPQQGGQDPINALQSMARQNTAAPQQMMSQMGVRPQMMNMQMDPQQQQQQQMNQMVMNQQQMQPQQTQQQPHMMNQFNQNMNMGNPMMQQQMASNQGNIGQPVNQPGSVLLNQLSQQGMNPVNPGMPRPRFPAQQAKMTPQQQGQQPQQQPQTQQQQQMMNQQLTQIMIRKQQQQQHQQAQQQQNQQQPNEMQMQQNQGPTTPQFVQGSVQGPVQGVGVPSPAPMPMQSMTSVASIGSGPMGAPSPAYVHSPGNVQIASSPATAARMGAPQQHQQRGMTGLGGLLPPPSPSMTNAPTPGGGGMLHTPQGAGMGVPLAGTGGPMSVGSSSEDQLYFEKVRQLSRFIEPLSRLINRYGEGDDSEKLSKMKIMLEVLKNPSKRMPMDTLLKCEAVLEKMDFKRTDTGSVAPPSVASVPSLGVAVPSVKEQPPASAAQLHPLLETIANQARSPYINHTLKRTFAPAVDALIGSDIGPPSPVKRGRHTSGDSAAIEASETCDVDELMVAVEREVANLASRFRIDLNPLHLSGSQDLHFICTLQDKSVPPVPPLKIVVPHDYPRTAPVCPANQQEYDVNSFTRAILQGLRNRIRHLPPRHSFSQVLNCWEMSLRHACGSTTVKDAGAASLILGV